MYGVVKIGDRDVPMLSMASTNVYYKRVFGEDPILLQADKDMTAGEGVNFAQQMAFIMAKQAEAGSDRKKMLQLNEESYLEWLDQFDGVDLENALEESMGVYRKDMRASSAEKKDQT